MQAKVRPLLAAIAIAVIAAMGLVLSGCGTSGDNSGSPQQQSRQYFDGEVVTDDSGQQRLTPEVTTEEVILAGSEQEAPQYRQDLRVFQSGNFVEQGLTGGTPAAQAENWISFLGTNAPALANEIWDTPLRPSWMKSPNDFSGLVINVVDANKRIVGQQLTPEAIEIHTRISVDIRASFYASTAAPEGVNTSLTVEGVVTSGTVIAAGDDLRVLVYTIAGSTRQVLIRCGNRVYYGKVEIPASTVIVIEHRITDTPATTSSSTAANVPTAICKGVTTTQAEWNRFWFDVDTEVSGGAEVRYHSYDFGNGIRFNFTKPKIWFEYSKPGVYLVTIRLTVKNPDGSTWVTDPVDECKVEVRVGNATSETPPTSGSTDPTPSASQPPSTTSGTSSPTTTTPPTTTTTQPTTTTPTRTTTSQPTESPKPVAVAICKSLTKQHHGGNKYSFRIEAAIGDDVTIDRFTLVYENAGKHVNLTPPDGRLSATSEVFDFPAPGTYTIKGMIAARDAQGESVYIYCDQQKPQAIPPVTVVAR